LKGEKKTVNALSPAKEKKRKKGGAAAEREGKRGFFDLSFSERRKGMSTLSSAL